MAYTRLAHRAQALACFVAPALLALAYIMLAARIGLFAKGSQFNDGSLKLEYALLGYWASLLLIPAWFALVYLVGQKSPRLAVICATIALFGFGPVIVGGLSAIFHAQGNVVIAYLSVGLAALLFQPLRERLQRAVNRPMFGQRDEPYAVLAQFGRQFETIPAPDHPHQRLPRTHRP